MIVVDASLATKWFRKEQDADQALAFLARHRGRLCGPDLLYTEVAGAIVRQANVGEKSLKEVHEDLKSWAHAWHEPLVRPFRMTARWLEKAGGLAIELGHPLPDCVYLALAIELDCDLATCDDKFRAKAGRLYPRVKALAEYAEGSMSSPSTRH